MIWAIVGFIGILVVVVAALSMLNAMTLTILERTRELATFRSLGFTRGQVTGLFLREATALTALGIAFGLLLGLAISAAVGAAHVEIRGVRHRRDPPAPPPADLRGLPRGGRRLLPVLPRRDLARRAQGRRPARRRAPDRRHRLT